jgi:hypothetical protein
MACGCVLYGSSRKAAPSSSRKAAPSLAQALHNFSLLPNNVDSHHHRHHHRPCWVLHGHHHGDGGGGGGGESSCGARTSQRPACRMHESAIALSASPLSTSPPLCTARTPNPHTFANFSTPHHLPTHRKRLHARIHCTCCCCCAAAGRSRR